MTDAPGTTPADPEGGSFSSSGSPIDPGQVRHAGDLGAAEAAFDAESTGAEEQDGRRYGPPPADAPDARP